MRLPETALILIKKYSRPLTRPDWKTQPKFTFSQFFQGIKKQNKYVLIHLYYKIVMGYCHHFILDKYNMFLTIYSKEVALQKIHKWYGLNPKITLLMCNIL
jgi:hypothetical protein